MSFSIINQDEFLRQFKEAISIGMREAAEPLIQKYLIELEAKMRKAVYDQAVTVASHYTIRDMGKSLEIRVENPKVRS